MGNCLTPAELEHLAIEHRSDDTLPVPKHLLRCRLCMSIFVGFVDFHSQVQAEYEVQEPATLQERLVSRNSSIYRLDALNLLPSARPVPAYVPSLAADSEVFNPSTAQKRTGVYTSSDGQLMIRILEGQDKTHTLYLLSEKEQLYKNVLVRIISHDQDYVSDANGRIKLGKIDLPDLGELALEVRTPEAVFDLKNYFPQGEELLGEEEVILDHSDDRRYKMVVQSIDGKLNLKISLANTVTSYGTDRIKVMVLRSERPAEVKQFRKGIALFEDIRNPADIQLKIFA